MILSDGDIKKAFDRNDIQIHPYKEQYLQPASYDLHLGRDFVEFKRGVKEIDLMKPVEHLMNEFTIDEGSLIIKAGEFLLAITEEVIGVGDGYAARMDGKSSLARIGLLIHISAGFVDPGNKLKLTLELFNASGRDIILYPGMPIAQVSFHIMSSPVEKPYGSDESLNSKYFGATKPQPSQFYKNFI